MVQRFKMVVENANLIVKLYMDKKGAAVICGTVLS
jgi:hypothetical protein